jgi:glycosyltransferase involved in cell wall biosynthesis
MKISIVTAVYNRARTIGDAIRSVSEQDHPDVEHVVIDGASNDATMQIVRSSVLRLPIVVSEPDAGIYDALNKGVQRATGDVVGLLHSDDVFADHRVVSDVAACFSDPAVNLVYGDLDYVGSRDGQRVVRHWKAGHLNSAGLRAGWMPPHPTVFVKADLYRSLGWFRTEFSISADYELMLRMFLSGKVVHRYLPRVLVRMRTGGESNRSIERILTKSSEDFAALRWNGFTKAGAVRALLLKNLRKVGQLFGNSSGM